MTNTRSIHGSNCNVRRELLIFFIIKAMKLTDNSTDKRKAVTNRCQFNLSLDKKMTTLEFTNGHNLSSVANPCEF